MIAFGSVGTKCHHQIPETFTIRELTEHQGEQLVPADEVFHIFVPLMGTDNIIELIPIQKGNKLRENEFVFMHCKSVRVAKNKIEIRLIKKPL